MIDRRQKKAVRHITGKPVTHRQRAADSDQSDVLFWTPTQDNPSIGSRLLLWGRDRKVLATYGYSSRDDAERMATERGWRFEQAQAAPDEDRDRCPT